MKNTNIFKILLINKNLFIYNQSNKKQKLLIENVNYNEFNICFFYYQKNKINIFLNDKHKNYDENIDLKNIKLINIELGYCHDDKSKYNGIIGPVIIFNKIVNKDQLQIINLIKDRLKGQYYMIAETYYKDNNNDNDKDINIFFSYEKYKGTIINALELINEIKLLFKNIILYINPDNILNHLKIGKTKYRDEKIYNNFNSKQSDNINIYYILQNNKDIANYIHNNSTLVSCIMNNHGLNYFILNIECIYNYLMIQRKDDIPVNELEIM